MQEMLPQKNDKKGYLVKQGGGRKAWQKRWFVLKTNFVCYYKDNKSLLHPQGVIDLADSSVRLTPYDSIKKKFCFEIVTPTRTYYAQGTDDKETTEWIKAIDAAKAKYRSEIASRKTFYNIKDTGGIEADSDEEEPSPEQKKDLNITFIIYFFFFFSSI